MEHVIEMRDVTKIFKVLNRKEGLKGAFTDLFSRDYREVRAVDGISMTIEPGEMVGYLGPNGAGKSTTIKIMTGILEPTDGTILVNGRVPCKNRVLNARDIGVVFGQRSQLWWSLPVIESFKILKEIYAVPDNVYKKNMQMYDDLVNVGSLYGKPVRQMSLGQRTLCDILAAFLHDPGIVFLDEPTIGLDVSMRAKIRELITVLNREKKTTVVLTSHDMGDVEALSRRIMIIDHGKMIYDDSIEQLRKYFGSYRTMRILPADAAKELTEGEAEEFRRALTRHCPAAECVNIRADGMFIAMLIPEDKISLMQVLGAAQKCIPVSDVRIEEIAAETVIRKIYDGVTGQPVKETGVFQENGKGE